MNTEAYRRTYINGSKMDHYSCPKCGNDQFAAGAIYCHVCGQKLPAGMYIESRIVIPMVGSNVKLILQENEVE